MDSQNLKNILGIEECVRYYPPNIERVRDAGTIFRNDREIDVYLHIPFCRTPCNFCPFNRYLYRENEVKLYLSAIEKEVKILKTFNDLKQLRIKTVWIGGGTPSDLEESALEEVLRIIHENFNLDHVNEFTIEAKPFLRLFTESKIRLLKRYKVNRVSLGIQSTKKEYLEQMGRGYSPDEAFEMIKRIKQNNLVLNIDMMYRLPGQTTAEVVKDVERVKSLGIDHFSWFPYVTHQGTPFAERIAKGELPPKADKARYFEMFKTIVEIMGGEGYQLYTPYYFSKTEENKCQYHIGRWQMPQRETLGIGAGAFSCFNGWIYANAHNLTLYQKAVNRQRPPVVMSRKISPVERITRLAVLGIKFFDIVKDDFQKYSGVEMGLFYQKELKVLEKLGLIKITRNKIECTLLGKAFNNDIAMYFSTDSAKLVKQPQATQLISKGL